MPNVDNDNILAALYLYKGRIDTLKKQAIDTVVRAEAEEITELEGELRLSLIDNEVEEIVECIDVLNHLLGPE